MRARRVQRVASRLVFCHNSHLPAITSTSIRTNGGPKANDHNQGDKGHSSRPFSLPEEEQVFRKYSHSLGPESLEFLEDILDRHETPDDEVEFSIEWIAKEYNKQDGALC